MPRKKTDNSVEKEAKTTQSAAKKEAAATKIEVGMPKSAEMQDRCAVLGKNIRQERKNRKFTMEELVNMLSISESYLGLLERGKRTPSLECLFEFCKTFGLTPNDLLLSRDAATSKKQLKASDPGVASVGEQFNAALSLLRSLSEEETEYIVSVMVGLKKIRKNKKTVKLSEA